MEMIEDVVGSNDELRSGLRVAILALKVMETGQPVNIRALIRRLEEIEHGAKKMIDRYSSLE